MFAHSDTKNVLEIPHERVKYSPELLLTSQDAGTAVSFFLLPSPTISRTYESQPLVIHALVKASGKLGLSAFLPPATRVLREESAVSEDVTLHLPPPHLPLVKDWHDGDFTLAGSLGPWSTRAPNDLNVREWTMKMLMRYRFSLGKLLPSFNHVSDFHDYYR